MGSSGSGYFIPQLGARVSLNLSFVGPQEGNFHNVLIVTDTIRVPGEGVLERIDRKGHLLPPFPPPCPTNFALSGSQEQSRSG